ncbi:FtsB family cell division protein [Texcoconibacillus texcoconensis]|uniref:Cell division protein DivIC n=1 Tax=Texcoconibacillus texcoconensis TaxID=1095777 RepID=A0A840QTM3_9BACI|nr:septum formation initiator family protein [Texcoconibacillus texcoconensis]MBB5174896.1 cell division protein DivIC [Texcoconibacillus texcoconensis]
MASDRSTKVETLKSAYYEQQQRLDEQKRRRRKGLYRRLSIAGLFMITFLIFTSVTLHSQANSIEQQKEEKNVLEQELEQLKAEEQDLRQEVDNLHDYEYIAEIARRDYFLTKPGETLFQIPNSSSD